MNSLRVTPFLALGLVLFAWHSPGMAASADELADIRNQLRSLQDRVQRLEEENAALKARNDALRDKSSGARRAAAPTPTSEQVASAESTKWTERVKVNGDLRYRHEQTRDDTLNAAGVRSTADRYRDRIRARLNVEAKATDTLSIGVGFATAENGDPRSSNQSLGDAFSRKGVDLELAYFDWSFAKWGHVIGGKMKQPFFRPTDSLFWDSDINPEGLALTFEHGVLFGSAYSFWIDEVSGPESIRTSDAMLFGGQLGARLPIGESTLVVAAHYYDLSAGQGRAPFYDDNPNGNTTITVGNTEVLRYDYRVVDLMAEWSTRWNSPWGSMPLTFWADVAQNQDPSDLETAWSSGAKLGNAADPRTWEFGAAYYSVEKDALFAQLIDADLAGGVSDGKGWVLRAGYAPVKNVAINAAYWLNKRNMDVRNAAGQRNVDYERLQLDLNMKF